ncbi:MAG: hypothetical protein FD130_1579 [Halothiobacillaceae bacterium]|nr:MAG: hypothetical protein FD130_1579 [Halothiobacillaceae bacterium]
MKKLFTSALLAPVVTFAFASVLFAADQGSDSTTAEPTDAATIERQCSQWADEDNVSAAERNDYIEACIADTERGDAAADGGGVINNSRE